MSESMDLEELLRGVRLDARVVGDMSEVELGAPPDELATRRRTRAVA